MNGSSVFVLANIVSSAREFSCYYAQATQFKTKTLVPRTSYVSKNVSHAKYPTPVQTYISVAEKSYVLQLVSLK